MTSLVTRKLHSLLPRMARAGVTSRKKGLVEVRMFSPVVVREDLVRMVVGGQRWYSVNTSAVQVERKDGQTRRKKKNTSKSQQEEVMDIMSKLDLEVRRTGRAPSFQLEQIVRKIETSGVCTANHALLVLRCCGEVLVDVDRENRTKLVQRYKDTIKRSGIEFDVSHFNALLKVSAINLGLIFCKR